MLFAYLLEAHPRFKGRVAQIAQRMEELGDTVHQRVYRGRGLGRPE
jgi:hypothetical protein